jgi:hypothetical protein
MCWLTGQHDNKCFSHLLCMLLGCLLSSVQLGKQWLLLWLLQGERLLLRLDLRLRLLLMLQRLLRQRPLLLLQLALCKRLAFLLRAHPCVRRR